MRLLSLSLQNIGPFDDAHLELLSDPEDRPAVTLLTGENGTGKSVLLDAIRGLFGQHFCKLERTLWRPDTPFQVELYLELEGKRRTLSSNTPWQGDFSPPSDHYLFELPKAVRGGAPCPG